MKFKPRDYQLPAINHIALLDRSALWAGMGLGKTVSTLTALDNLFLVGDSYPALVIAPLRVARSTWPDEARKWDHLSSIVISPVVGTETERIAALKRDASVYTINYENLPWLVNYYGSKWPFRHVIADESTKLKGFRLQQGSKRARELARVAHTLVQRFTNLTGTPAPNGLIDLWGQTYFIDKGMRLGRSFSAFQDRWFQAIQKGDAGYTQLRPLPYAQEEIQDRLRDVCLTIDAADYFDLEQPIVNNIFVELPGKARLLYQQMEREMFMELAGIEIEAVNAAARTNKCLQLANGAAYIDDKQNWEEVHDAKLQALEDIIEEAAGAPVLVAYHFKSDLTRLQRTFPKCRVLDADPVTIQQWNAGRIPILLAHPASAGHGLNLQDGGNILVYFGHNWNLEERMQILERIGPTRQLQAGHNRPVFVHNIIARNTVDELVIARVETKKTIQEILLEAMKDKGVAK